MAIDTIPIVNAAGAEVLSTELGGNLQLIPGTTSTGEELWVANIFCVTNCIDWGQSRAEIYPSNYPLPHLAGRVKIALELVLDDAATHGLAIFRLPEDPLKLIVRNDFLEKLDAQRLKGLCPAPLPRYRSS